MNGSRLESQANANGTRKAYPKGWGLSHEKNIAMKRHPSMKVPTDFFLFFPGATVLLILMGPSIIALMWQNHGLVSFRSLCCHGS